MNRRFLSFSNSLFWVLIFLGGVYVFWRNQPKSTVTLRTSSTRKYEIAVFTSPSKWGGTRWSIYRRALNSQATSDWKYVMAMASGEPVKTVNAWQSGDGNRVLVTFPDSYIAANLQTGVLERAALVIGGEGDLENIKSTLGIYDDLTFAKPHKIGPWLWQDRQWKGMLHNDPQIQL
ncbi:hypothetical protein IAD21_03587 [Abditibacteriota bacterium]|nr:hypothetical protein IAD21_03587 [Abditibacteriota bacterium]